MYKSVSGSHQHQNSLTRQSRYLRSFFRRPAKYLKEKPKVQLQQKNQVADKTSKVEVSGCYSFEFCLDIRISFITSAVLTGKVLFSTTIV